MDPYEILGIRPNAGRDEIELAYKGRRSQYHPDRYAQSDAETQAWATGKMQEVNEAYRLLRQSDLRAEVDRRKASGHPKSDQPSRGQAAADSGIPDVAAILLKQEWEWFHDKVYARPNIPRKKLEGAISSYAPAVSPGDVLVLLDDTLFGGAKEGLLVTRDAIYCKQKFTAPRRILFGDIPKVEPGTHSRVFINGDEFFKADLVDHLAVLTFTSRLSTVFKTLEPSVDGSQGVEKAGRTPGVDRLQAVHRKSMAALRSEMGGDPLLLGEMIDRQMHCIVGRYSQLRDAAERHPERGSRPVDAEVIEMSLLLFLILHYYAFSMMSAECRREIAGNMSMVLAASEIYKGKFVEAFPLVCGIEFVQDQESLTVMPMIFFHRDGEGEVELKMPREEMLLQMLSKTGLTRGEARALIGEFSGHVDSWISAVSAA